MVTSKPAASEPRRLSDSELAELMRLVKGADSVELKLTVPGGSHVTTIRGLDIDPVEAQPRQVFFFDTPDLALNAAGVVVRARRIQGGRGDTVVKLRPVEPGDLSPELRKDPSFNVEVDALPGGFVCSASFKGRTTGDEIRDAVRGKLAIRRLFSKGQRAFYAAHAPDGIALDSLVPLGPTFLLKTRTPIQLGSGKSSIRQLVAELWLYPDGSRILELSTKCLPSETFQVAAETRAFLADRGIDTSGVQQTKTRTALEFHAKAAETAQAEKAEKAAKAEEASDQAAAPAKAGKSAKSAKSAKPAKSAKAARTTTAATSPKPAKPTRAASTKAAKASRSAKATKGSKANGTGSAPSSTRARAGDGRFTSTSAAAAAEAPAG